MQRLSMTIAFTLLTGFGCAKKQVRLERYQVDKPKGDWKPVKSGSADYAWYNSDIGATIYIDSNCGQKFEDRSLRDSLQSLTVGIRTSTEPIERELFLDGREARMLQTKGNLDGVDIQMAAVALSKHQCLFDFVYVTRPETFADGFSDFNQLLYTFKTRTGWSDVLESPSKRDSQ